MAQRKTREPANTAHAVLNESIQRVEAPSEVVSGRISLRVTAAQLAECISRQKNALAQIIANPTSPPIDGGILRMVGALDALARIDPEL